MDPTQAQLFIDSTWDESITPVLEEFIRIPNKSPSFDADWQAHGYMDQAVKLLKTWCEAQDIKGMQIEVVQLAERTPLLFIEVAGQVDETVLLYGHLDKQPEMVGWDDDLGPWQPVIKNDRLYGRGGADDGYAVFAALTAIRALQLQNIPHARCVVVIEACEESGSYDLPAYMDHLTDRIGTPKLVIGLDSGCGNYEQLWVTSSLRGMMGGVLTAEILTEGVHSGAASGIVPSSFRIIRNVLNNVEKQETGEIILSELSVDIPEFRIKEAKQVADVLGDEVRNMYPFVNGATAVEGPGHELVLNRTWRPTMSVTGAADMPPLEQAGSVLRPKTSLALSFRLPPTCEPEPAVAAIKKALEDNPPYQAKVNFEPHSYAKGWHAPPVAKWLEDAVQSASQAYYGKPALYWGEGGTIPFMAMLGDQFPEAQFLITGVLGPHSNAHGPNEFLHIPMAKKLTACVASVLNCAS